MAIGRKGANPAKVATLSRSVVCEGSFGNKNALKINLHYVFIGAIHV